VAQQRQQQSSQEVGSGAGDARTICQDVLRVRTAVSTLPMPRRSRGEGAELTLSGLLVAGSFRLDAVRVAGQQQLVRSLSQTSSPSFQSSPRGVGWTTKKVQVGEIDCELGPQFPRKSRKVSARGLWAGIDRAAFLFSSPPPVV
jgi:hypothetical protein